MGIYLSDQERDCLTNLRFADDVMLFATSKEQIRNMMCEFKDATEKVGLRIHPDKTNILSNQSNMNADTKKINHGGQIDYRPAFFISTSNSGKNNRDPAKVPRIPGKWP